MAYGFMPSVYPPVSAGYVFMNSLNGAFPPSYKHGASADTLQVHRFCNEMTVTKHRITTSHAMRILLYRSLLEGE